MADCVLIHGAYQGGWIWKPAPQRLRAVGHTVHPPSLDDGGERASQRRPGIDTESPAREIVDLLLYEDLDDVVTAPRRSAAGRPVLEPAFLQGISNDGSL